MPVGLPLRTNALAFPAKARCCKEMRLHHSSEREVWLWHIASLVGRQLSASCGCGMERHPFAVIAASGYGWPSWWRCWAVSGVLLARVHVEPA
jgi:hypothetical protein